MREQETQRLWWDGHLHERSVKYVRSYRVLKDDMPVMGMREADCKPGTELLCTLCGEAFEAREVVAGLGKGLWPVCPWCLGAGKEGAIERAREHLRDMRVQADMLESLLAEMPTKTVDWPDISELDNRITLVQAERRRGVAARDDDVPF